MKVIDFHAEWCGPCDAQDPILDEVESQFDVDVERIDVDEEQDVANDYGVRGIPFIVIEVDGDVKYSSQGLTQFEELELAIESIRNS